jgi:hypothetical protein
VGSGYAFPEDLDCGKLAADLQNKWGAQNPFAIFRAGGA